VIGERGFNTGASSEPGVIKQRGGIKQGVRCTRRGNIIIQAVGSLGLLEKGGNGGEGGGSNRGSVVQDGGGDIITGCSVSVGVSDGGEGQIRDLEIWRDWGGNDRFSRGGGASE